MRKNLICLLMCLFAINTFAQPEKGFTVGIDYRWCVKPTLKKSSDFMSSDFVSTFGYQFNKYLSVRVPVSREIALFDKDGLKTWVSNQVLGLGMGVNVFVREDGAGFFELNASAGSTLDGDDTWKYAYYDAGFNIVLGQTIKANLGFGARYYDARRGKNRLTMYGILGLQVNINATFKKILAK
ncbi:MAG: hypothetical protein LBT27_04745 [Prevotellaceae bacterium]|jgi:hypothetical protein|nr:hypothetical protein [Prevotellaceae bacterium]